MDLQLTGKTAVVTGASRGIGLAIARALSNEGVRVVGAARTITPDLRRLPSRRFPPTWPLRRAPPPSWTRPCLSWVASTS